jgi:hypothetical protein
VFTYYLFWNDMIETQHTRRINKRKKQSHMRAITGRGKVFGAAAFERRLYHLLLLVLAVVLISAPGFIQCRGEEYSVTGVLEMTTKVRADEPGNKVSHDFWVDASQSRYRIRIRRQDGDANNYHEYFFADGTLMWLHHLVGPARRLGSASFETNAAPMYSAGIEEREIPQNDGTRAQYVW